MIRTLKDLFKWWLCDSLWWTITSVLPIYIIMSILMKNNNIFSSFLSLSILMCDLYRGYKILPEFSTKVGVRLIHE